MVNTIWKEVFLIMCSHLKGNARYSGRFPPVLRITEDYTLQILCGSPHKVCDDEGKLNGKPLNRALRDEDGTVYDIVAGTFFVCGLGEEDFASLPKELQKKYKDKFRKPEAFLKMGRSIKVVPIEPKAPAGKGEKRVSSMEL